MSADIVEVSGQHCILSVGVDITERKRIEEALQQSHDQLRHLAQRLTAAEETERQRLARELHDQVGQNLAVLGLTLYTINDLVADQIPKSATERLASAIQLVEGMTERIRNVMQDLRPSMLDDFGIIPALQWAGNLLCQQSGLTVEVMSIGESERLASDVEMVLFRIAQEALTNVLKHAQATTVFLTLEMTTDSVRLTIADDGVGFDTQARLLVGAPRQRKCWGLIMMQERALGVGGTVQITSQPGHGTHVIIDIPRRYHDDHSDRG
jgi:signal transduction histidine kinase